MNNTELELYRFAHAHLTSGDLQKAVHIFHMLTLLHPMTPLYYLGLAEGYLAQKKYDEAEKICAIATYFINRLPTDSDEQKTLQEIAEKLIIRLEVGI